MKARLASLFFLCLCSLTSLGQARVELSANLFWETDSSIRLYYQATNFGAEQLIQLSLKMKQNSWSWEADSMYLGKGISSYQKSLKFLPEEYDLHQDTAQFSIQWHSVKGGQLLKEMPLKLLPRLSPWARMSVQDYSIQIEPAKNGKIQLSIAGFFADSSEANSVPPFKLERDTNFLWHKLITADPQVPRFFVVRQENEAGESQETVFWYENAQFFERPPVKEVATEAELKKERLIQFSGFVEAESNFFSQRPEHANGSQYPYSAFRASNTISIHGIPFTLNAFHSTNQNISPNFRNFFSLQFDVQQFRENIQNQLLNEELGKKYAIPDLNADILSNEQAIADLEKAKQMALQYPNQDIPFDSLYQKQFEQAISTHAKDSLIVLDTAFTDSIPSLPTTNYLAETDSSISAQQQKLAQIQRAIDGLERSNELKRKYLTDLKSRDAQIPTKVDDPRQLFRQFGQGGLASLLLRFEKIDIGNFYEYAGRYSIRDIEMRGLNLEFLLNETTSINFLTANINDFQSFNLDRIDANKKVNSVAIKNQAVDYFQPTVRLTQFKDETIDPELNNGQQQYYLFSIGATGSISDYAYYETEISRNNEQLDPFAKDANEDFNERSAYYGKLMITPFSALDINLQYDRVGSLYRSDGVYFLNRNMQAYTLGYKLRLFKNKLHIKNDYSIMQRNFEQKDLTNQTERLFFDVGTHFKRLPNIQLSYSPISIELANKLDTSFSGLNANTNVLIARLSYFKKIKKTFITTALIYNEVENEIADDFSTQKGIQHFASVSNEKVNASFTSSYNKTFNSIRFISATYGQQLNDKLRINLNVAKNFANHFYSEIIRSELAYQITKSFTLGAGGIFLIENESGFVNTGGSVRLRFNY